MTSIYWINICLIFLELLTGNYLIPAEWIGGYQAGLVGGRPGGIFILAHVSITYIAIYLIYVLELPKSRFTLVTIISGLIAMYFSGFGTGFYAFIIWYIITRTSKVPILKYFTNGYILVLTVFLLIFFANLTVLKLKQYIAMHCKCISYFLIQYIMLKQLVITITKNYFFAL